MDDVSNPFALEKILAWVETKPADEAYDASRAAKCDFRMGWDFDAIDTATPALALCIAALKARAVLPTQPSQNGGQ